ncbi:MAG: tetratricopeptide repeat protein [Erythrobacter sp.]|nr:tetratricopeptide repeat protein [Erythrobacter sp.]
MFRRLPSPSDMASLSKGMALPRIGLAVSTALASLALAGCTTASAPSAQTSFAKAQSALEDGQIDRAIGFAEAAVLADPRSPAIRALLGSAYLEAGRFQSAATSFSDALELGERNPRTVLSYALAETALGAQDKALAILAEYEGAIPASDLGLAYALAGKPERGIHLLINAVRQGYASPKVRQNLAYAYALSGNWRAARVMAAEDVPAGELDQRLSDWAASARPEDYRSRVAGVLNVTPVSDGGLPMQLALSNFPSQEQMAAEAVDLGGVALAEGEVEVSPTADERMAFGIDNEEPAEAETDLAALARLSAAQTIEAIDPTPPPAVKVPARQAGASQASAPAPSAGARFVSNAMVQNVPAARNVAASVSAKPAKAPVQQRRMANTDIAADTHLVQLGSFDTKDVAEAKWSEFQRRFPALKSHDVVITEALVKGRTYFRVAAAGFGAGSAQAMCGTVKAKGLGCFAYDKSNPPAGAVDRGRRIAARTN